MRPHDTEYPASLRKGFLVYAWIGTDGTWLYVGQSTVGLCRPFSLGHGSVGIEGTIRVWHCASFKEAKDLEAELVREQKPAQNRVMFKGPAPKKPRLCPVCKKELRAFARICSDDCQAVMSARKYEGRLPPDEI